MVPPKKRRIKFLPSSFSTQSPVQLEVWIKAKLQAAVGSVTCCVSLIHFTSLKGRIIVCCCCCCCCLCYFSTSLTPRLRPTSCWRREKVKWLTLHSVSLFLSSTFKGRVFTCASAASISHLQLHHQSEVKFFFILFVSTTVTFI